MASTEDAGRPAVLLEPLTVANWRRALEVEVGPGQLPFVAEVEPVALLVLAKAYVRPAGLDWRPFAFVERGAVVGVVALAIQVPPTACDIVHLLVDRRHQGRGVGTAGLAAVLAHVRHALPSCRRVALTVHPENVVARRIYERAGFRATGAHRDGEPILALQLPAP